MAALMMLSMNAEIISLVIILSEFIFMMKTKGLNRGGNKAYIN